MRNVTVLFVIFTSPGTALAQGDRSRPWEWSFAALYQESRTMGSEGGSTLDIDAALGLGFNVTYNFRNRLALGFDLDWLSPVYRAVLIDDTVAPADTTVIDHDFTQFNGRVKGTFSLLDGPFEPYVEAGIGWSYFDSNIADGPPISAAGTLGGDTSATVFTTRCRKLCSPTVPDWDSATTFAAARS